MTIQELFVRTNEELLRIVQQITDDQWQISLPPGLSRTPSTLLEAVNYHSYDDAWVPDVLAGKTKEEVGDVYEALRAAADPRANYVKYNAIASEAVRNFLDLDKVVYLSYGDFPARDYLQHTALFRGLRSYDIAGMIGVDSKMAEDFAQAMYDEYVPLADGYRQYGILPAAIPVASDADIQTKLLGLVGRK